MMNANGVATGAAMEWSEGDNWALQLDLAPGAYDFKCIVARPDGSIAAWEPGSNRHIDVSPHPGPMHAEHVLLCPAGT